MGTLLYSNLSAAINSLAKYPSRWLYYNLFDDCGTGYIFSYAGTRFRGTAVFWLVERWSGSHLRLSWCQFLGACWSNSRKPCSVELETFTFLIEVLSVFMDLYGFTIQSRVIIWRGRRNNGVIKIVGVTCMVFLEWVCSYCSFFCLG